MVKHPPDGSDPDTDDSDTSDRKRTDDGDENIEDLLSRITDMERFGDAGAGSDEPDEAEEEPLEPPKVELYVDDKETPTIDLPKGFNIDNEMIEDIIRQLLKNFPIDEIAKGMGSKPKIMGFQMRIDRDGDKHIERLPDNFAFDDVKKMFEKQRGAKPRRTVTVKADRSAVSEPEAELIEEPDAYYITIDLPGVEREEMKLSVSDTRARLFATAHGRTYKKKFELDSEIDRSKVKARLKNGILDVYLPKKEADIDMGSEVAIE